MAVPKKKTSPSKKRMRSSGKFLKPTQFHHDSNGNACMSHRIDSNGMYNGMQIIIKKEKKNKNQEDNNE
jgi:large subunit ribosomal protein L32